jgi:vancomycin resistance protein VanW
MPSDDRRLFCEISPTTYRISAAKERTKRFAVWAVHHRSFARERSNQPLPVLVCAHNSLIRRRLGDVDPVLQENKATNLALAAPRIDGVLLRPGQVFSFWRLVGEATPRRGYRTGLVIRSGSPDAGVGGGLCQFTNLLHWMALHSSLTISEHHHHNQLDLFPDYGRELPFGTGTSVAYPHVDYQLRNETANTFQLRVHVSETHLRGELRALEPEPLAYHVVERDMHFSRERDGYYRSNEIWRRVVDKGTGHRCRATAAPQPRQGHVRRVVRAA